MTNKDHNPYAPGVSAPILPWNDDKIPFRGRNLWGSLLAMLPWPLLAIAGCWGMSIFEKASDAILLFGGATMIVLLPLALFVSAEWIFGVLIAIVWLLALLLPIFYDRKSVRPKHQLAVILVGQSIFSAIQAVLGFLMLLGRQV